MITKRAIFRMWHKGLTMGYLCSHYNVSHQWVESAIRKYVAKAYQ